MSTSYGRRASELGNACELGPAKEERELERSRPSEEEWAGLARRFGPERHEGSWAEGADGLEDKRKQRRAEKKEGKKNGPIEIKKERRRRKKIFLK